MTRYLIAALLLFALITGASANSKDDSLIGPGRSLGPISLGMTLNEIEEVIEAPRNRTPMLTRMYGIRASQAIRLW